MAGESRSSFIVAESIDLEFMTVDYLFRLKFRATLFTVGVSLWFLIRLWREGELFGAQQAIFCLWFIIALLTQLFARAPGVWIAGFSAQLVLAVVLIVKQQMDDIY